MRPQPGNPFRDLHGRELSRACGQYIKALQARKSRSVAERAQLAEDVAYLLIAVSRYIDGPCGAPSSPEHQVGLGGEFAQLFRQHHLAEQQRLRYRTLRRAADLALKEHSADWLRSLGHGIDDEYARALGNDATLIKRLRELEKAFLQSKEVPDGAA